MKCSRCQRREASHDIYEKGEVGDRVKVEEDHPAPFLAGKTGDILEIHPHQGLVKIDWDRPYQPATGYPQDTSNVDIERVKLLDGKRARRQSPRSRRRRSSRPKRPRRRRSQRH
jgi:hypothetical protein